jgi:nicotinamidase-related amidase
VERVRDKTFFSTVDEVLAVGHTALVMYDPLTVGLQACENAMPDGGDLVDRWERLLDAARHHDVPVLYSRTVDDLSRMTGPWLRHLSRNRPTGYVDRLSESPPPMPMSDSDDAFVPRLRPAQGEIIISHTYYDLFTGTRLAELGRERNVESLLLTGVATESGIWETARRAAAEGFYAVIVEDCVFSTRPEMHADAITHLRTHFDVVSADDVLAIWGERSRGPDAAPSDPEAR